MKKILFGLIILIVIVAGAIYLYPKPQSNSVASSSPDMGASSTTPIHVLISNIGFGSGKIFPITNSSTQDVLSIKDTGNEAQNPSAYIGGYQSMSSFSPDNNYFAVLDTYDDGCAGNCFGFSIPVINLASDTIVTLEPQPAPHDEYIESYTWDGNDAIDVTSYEITYSGGSLITNPDYYRVSPKQVWRYDLTTGSSTLISQTP
jgi:hypothetical protein